MVRLVIYLLTILLIASGLAWLADRPGTLQIAWQGYDIETSVFRATVILAAAIAATILLWSIVRTIWNSPAALGHRIVRRRQKRGIEALSSGMIAVGAGDRTAAAKYALLARKALPHEPLTHLLRAQAAQLSGDRATTRRIYEAMLASPETEQLGLRGLYLEAEREGETEAALQFAHRASKANPRLIWSAEAQFELQCKQKDWAAALNSLAGAKRSGLIDTASLNRKRAVLLAAQAQDAEEPETDKALSLALEAHALAPDLVPAAVVAGRILASRGSTSKAAKVVHKTWLRAPHPDLATVYAHARVGDSTRDRLDRVRHLSTLNPQSIEGPIAIATTAIDARHFDEARAALEPLLANRMTQRVALLMARLEAGQTGDKGKVREWLARAANAARDPVWFADGVISNRWEPVSPVTGRLDAFQWRVPAESLDPSSADLVASRIEELLALSGPASDSDVKIQDTTGIRHAAGGDVVDAEAVTVALESGGKTHAEAGVEQGSANAAPLKPVPASHSESATKPGAVKPVIVAPASTAGNGDATREQTSEPKIYVAPHAPDDPGLEEAEADFSASYTKRSYRAVN